MTAYSRLDFFTQRGAWSTVDVQKHLRGRRAPSTTCCRKKSPAFFPQAVRFGVLSWKRGTRRAGWVAGGSELEARGRMSGTRSGWVARGSEPGWVARGWIEDWHACPTGWGTRGSEGGWVADTETAEARHSVGRGLCRGLALCQDHRSLCRGPALAGARALGVGLLGPGALCVRARRSMSGLALSVSGSGAVCRGPALCVGPGALCVGPRQALGPDTERRSPTQ